MTRSMVILILVISLLQVQTINAQHPFPPSDIIGMSLTKMMGIPQHVKGTNQVLSFIANLKDSQLKKKMLEDFKNIPADTFVDLHIYQTRTGFKIEDVEINFIEDSLSFAGKKMKFDLKKIEYQKLMNFFKDSTQKTSFMSLILPEAQAAAPILIIPALLVKALLSIGLISSVSLISLAAFGKGCDDWITALNGVLNDLYDACLVDLRELQSGSAANSLRTQIVLEELRNQASDNPGDYSTTQSCRDQLKSYVGWWNRFTLSCLTDETLKQFCEQAQPYSECLSDVQIYIDQGNGTIRMNDSERDSRPWGYFSPSGGEENRIRRPNISR